MNLNLPKTAAYKYQNEQTVREMCEMYNIKPSSVKNHKDLPWEEKYPLYMKDITGYTPCPICNGPMGFSFKHSRISFYPNGIICLNHPSHTVALTIAWMPTNRFHRKNPDATPEQVQEKYAHFVAVALGPVCEHNNFLVDCEVCIERAEQRHIEEEDIRVGLEAAKPHEEINDTIIEENPLKEEMSSVYA